MGLPRIAPYPMPTEPELPANRVPWTPDPARAVLLVHDMQHHFVDAFPAGEEPVAPLLANIARLRAACDRAGIPVLHCGQRGGQTPEQRGLQLDFWGPGPAADPYAEEAPEAVAPRPGDSRITKWKYSAFVRTDLEERLRALGRDELIITGIYARIGVVLTAADAWMRDIRAHLAGDAVADFSAADHREALSWAARTCAAVHATDRLIEQLGS